MRVPIGSNNNASSSQSDQCKDLLTYLESSRDLLARRIVHEHHSVTDPDLNYITVSSLLQILFLEIGQECGFVEPGTLTVLAECDGIAKRMARACSDAGLIPENLFERGPEGSRIFPGLPDEPLREIIQRMDQPDVPVPVSRLPLEELVTVIEQFLGTRMQAAEGCRVNRVGKSALLYTGVVDVPPQIVVEYMVSEALGGISDRSAIGIRTASRILDPACGSGLFLLAAYRYLVSKKTKALDRPEQVQNVLQDLASKSVFGTDIDPESVSAARIVLLFAFIEEIRRSGSGVASPSQIRKVCTYLIKTIRCGNALIAPDYFSGKPVYPFNADERRKVNPFDWQGTFPEIVAEGGFDAVIGAPPPYRPFVIPAREEYFQTHYDTYAPSAGLYGYFIERAFSLLKPCGIITVLVPGTFLRSQYAKPLRHLLLSRQIVTITNTGRTRLLPEGEALMYTLSLQNQPPDRPFIVSPDWNSARSRQGVFSGAYDFTLDQRSFDDGGWKLDDTRTIDILEKIQMTGTPLEDYVMEQIHHGIKTGSDDIFVIDETVKKQLITHDPRCKPLIRPLTSGNSIERYKDQKYDRSVIFIPKGWTNNHPAAVSSPWRWFQRRHPSIARHLKQFYKNANTRAVQGDFWWETAGDEEIKTGKNAQIIFKREFKKPAFTFSGDRAIPDHATSTVASSSLYLLGVLNSRLISFVFDSFNRSPVTGQKMFSGEDLKGLPIYTIDFDKPDDKARHDRMVTLVAEMLELHKHLSHAKTDQEKRLITQEIESTDRQIDSLVYGLYGLTADEIAVVEEATGK